MDQKTKDDIQFSYDRVRKFAEAQLKNYGQNFEVELSDGLYAGQKLVPVNTAGCYIPGGRYAHIASAVMSVTTAKVAGVKNVIAKQLGSDNLLNNARASICALENLMTKSQVEKNRNLN